ncbi:MAG: hypothetical protein KC482_11310 [Dehalococcoidia bacterium]|nr:hypothetical protein [Dehalococcoidia bacterium]
MTIRIPRPRLLLAVLVGAALLFGAYSVVADDPSSEPELSFTPIDDGAELPSVSPEEADRALQVLEAEPVFQAVTEGVEWELAQVLPNAQEGGGVSGLALIIELATPVDSDGPWTYVTCRGTRVTQSPAPFRAITTLSAGFNGDGDLLRFKPLLVGGTSLIPPEGPLLPTLEPCPPGFEDREN